MSDEEAADLCEKIRKQVLEHGVRERKDGGHYLAADFDSDAMDATAFLVYPTGFMDAELARGTREEAQRRIGDGPWVYRTEGYREHGEGAFLLCGFWRIGHLIREGHLDHAQAALEHYLANSSPLGLYAEEIDPSSGESRGNFPQGFSHLGLITTILDLQQAKKDPAFAKLPLHEKIRASVGRTIGLRAVIAGFFRVPRTLRLLFSKRSKWPAGSG